MGNRIWTRIAAAILALALPAAASAGPIRDAAEQAGRAPATADKDATRSRTRFWSGIALIAGGGALATLGKFELGDDETGPDDGEDRGDSDDGEDSDGWGNKALIGGGIAAAALGSVLLLTGRRGPELTVRPGRVMVRQTLRF